MATPWVRNRQAQQKAIYLKIIKIVVNNRAITCPIRDKMLVEKNQTTYPPRPVGTECGEKTN